MTSERKHYPALCPTFSQSRDNQYLPWGQRWMCPVFRILNDRQERLSFLKFAVIARAISVIARSKSENTLLQKALTAIKALRAWNFFCSLKGKPPIFWRHPASNERLKTHSMVGIGSQNIRNTAWTCKINILEENRPLSTGWSLFQNACFTYQTGRFSVLGFSGLKTVLNSGCRFLKLPISIGYGRSLPRHWWYCPPVL